MPNDNQANSSLVHDSVSNSSLIHDRLTVISSTYNLDSSLGRVELGGVILELYI